MARWKLNFYPNEVQYLFSMALTELWKSSPHEIEEKLSHQVIGFAEDGKLRDGSESCFSTRQSFLGES
jgi:hypothetical protein